jgi:hypothetical protein
MVDKYLVFSFARLDTNRYLWGICQGKSVSTTFTNKCKLSEDQITKTITGAMPEKAVYITCQKELNTDRKFATLTYTRLPH